MWAEFSMRGMHSQGCLFCTVHKLTGSLHMCQTSVMKHTYKPVLDIGPTEEECSEDRWPLEIGAFWFHGLLLRFCAFWWIIDRREGEDENGSRDKYRVQWVVGSLLLLTVFLLVNPPGILREVLAAIAA